MNIEEAHKLSKAIDFLDTIPQTPKSGNGGEFLIGKNDPKNDNEDYWWCSYRGASLSNYYSLTQMLIDLVKEIKVKKEA